MTSNKIYSTKLKPPASAKTSDSAFGKIASDQKKSDLKEACITANKHTTSEALFAGARELVIEHAGDIYRLRLTSLGKLILTK